MDLVSLPLKQSYDRNCSKVYDSQSLSQVSETGLKSVSTTDILYPKPLDYLSHVGAIIPGVGAEFLRQVDRTIATGSVSVSHVPQP